MPARGPQQRNGRGTTILSGNNSFTGGLTLVVGNLRVASANALGSGTLSLGNAGNVNSFSSDGPTPRTIANPVALTATGNIGLGDAALDGKLTFANTVEVGTANRTANASAITVGNTAGETGILEIRGDLPMAGAEFGVGATAAGATGIVNHSAGTVSFTSGNALLIGRTTGNVPGTYNLSGGELKTYSSTSRGVMIGVNAGSSVNPITRPLDKATGQFKYSRAINRG